MQPSAVISPPGPKSRLPRRDLVLLPLISLTTILLTGGAAEALARIWKPEYSIGSCSTENPAAGPRAKANCVMRMKNAEGPVVEYRFNQCGYRSTDGCGPKPPGALRIAVIGTSVALGMNVPYNDLFSVVAARQLTQLCGRNVQLENLGTWDLEANEQLPLLKEALSLQADAILFPLLPYDVETGFDRPPQLSAAAVSRRRSPPAEKLTPLARIAVTFRQSRALFCIQHSLLLDRDFLLRGYRYSANPDDLMHQPFSPAALRRFNNLDGFLTQAAARTRAAGAPLFLIPLPNRTGAALLSSHAEIHGVDARAFSREIAALAAAHGLQVADPTADFAALSHAEEAYYAVDGHPNSLGHAVVARAVIRALTSGAAPAFSPEPLGDSR